LLKLSRRLWLQYCTLYDYRFRCTHYFMILCIKVLAGDEFTGMVTQREVLHELQEQVSAHRSVDIRRGMLFALSTILQHQSFNAAVFDHEFDVIWRLALRKQLVKMAVDGFSRDDNYLNRADLQQSRIKANLQAIGRS
jgi:hypothetical protein